MWFKARAPALGDFEQLVLLGVLRLEHEGNAILSAWRRAPQGHRDWAARLTWEFPLTQETEETRDRIV